jgi:hypothetical protein
VDLSDPTAVAQVVVSCSLDHSYNRDGCGGVPWGLTERLREALKPVVARHLSLVEPEWEKKTVSMEERQKETFMQEVTAVVRGVMEETR